MLLMDVLMLCYKLINLMCLINWILILQNSKINMMYLMPLIMLLKILTGNILYSCEYFSISLRYNLWYYDLI